MTRLSNPSADRDSAQSGNDGLDAQVAKINHHAAKGWFVINLQASTAPIAVPSMNIPGCPHATAYQIQRIEDGRIRYRLRLGPFSKEEQAEAVLATVRTDYPGALTAAAAPDDVRVLAASRAKAQEVVAAVPVALAVKPPAPDAAVPVALAVKPPAPTTARPSEPTPPTRAATQGAKQGGRAPGLETTQTVRHLTPPELSTDDTPRWFVIELSAADHVFDPDTLPNLDIFTLYRLYSVAGLEQGRLLYSLRLGFFGEEIAARSVANYLANYYDNPVIKRVSVAERDRFAEQRVEARKDVGATGQHAIIEITSELNVREKRLAK